MKTNAIYLTLVLLLLLAQAVQAMSSENYSLDWMILLTSGGGGQAESIHYVANYSVGQTSIGQASSAGYEVGLGYWQPFRREVRLWLPLILK